MTYDVNESIQNRCGKPVTRSQTQFDVTQFVSSGSGFDSKTLMGFINSSHSNSGQCDWSRMLGWIWRQTLQEDEVVIHHTSENGPKCCNCIWNGHRWWFLLSSNRRECQRVHLLVNRIEQGIDCDIRGWRLCSPTRCWQTDAKDSTRIKQDTICLLEHSNTQMTEAW